MKDHPNRHEPYRIQVETITPVSVGNGQILSPYTDFVLDEDQSQVHLLDKEAISGAILDVGKPEVMNAYIDGIYGSFNNNRSEFDLKKFLEGHPVSLLPDDYTAQKIPFHGPTRRKKQEIKCIVKDNERPYIPGSTIKGAIKGALLYDWLKFEKSGKEAFKALMDQVHETYERCKGPITSIEQIARKQFVSRDDRFRIRDLKKQIDRSGGKKLKSHIDKHISALLTQSHDFFPNDFSHLKPADSALLERKEVIFLQTNRLHYSKGVVTIPVNLEAIPAKSTTYFDLSIIPQFYQDAFHYLNEAHPIESLFTRLNKFHKDNIDMELELLDLHPWYDRARGIDRDIFRDYTNYLERLYTVIDNTSSKEAYLCLGFGKSFFYNSIGMLINDWDDTGSLAERRNSTFSKYAQLMFLGNDGQKHFPLTRTVTHDRQPMGWVKLSENRNR